LMGTFCGVITGLACGMMTTVVLALVDVEPELEDDDDGWVLALSSLGPGPTLAFLDVCVAVAEVLAL
jgi:hypothetical protein